MNKEEINVLNQIYGRLATRLGGVDTLNIKIKRNKDGEITVNYNASGTGKTPTNKTVKISKSSDKKNKSKKSNPVHKKGILKKEKKNTKWEDEGTDSESEGESIEHESDYNSEHSIDSDFSY
ncbi:MAG: hypothetical protein KGZ34_04495 [Nitrosarchaeum sp.]|nr:hypothetical protein [Nitrosarchaeum sp.]